MQRLIKAFTSSIGLKIVMALTGAALLLFVIAHMLGNLQIFLGQDTINNYAHMLKSKPALLWGARLGLLGVFVAHIGAAMRLSAINKAARPSRYVYDTTVQASYASRTMLFTGMMVAVFVVFHLAHFTGGVFDSRYLNMEHNGHHDVYGMVVTAFNGKEFISLLYVIIYVAANALLAFHISHGASSLFQTLGLTQGKFKDAIKFAGPGLGVVIAIGNIAIPLAIYLGACPLAVGAGRG